MRVLTPAALLLAAVLCSGAAQAQTPNDPVRVHRTTISRLVLQLRFNAACALLTRGLGEESAGRCAMDRVDAGLGTRACQAQGAARARLRPRGGASERRRVHRRPPVGGRA